MRFFSSFSASLMVLALGGTAFAASAPRTLVEVGSFSPASAKPLASVDASALDASARSVLAERAPWSQKLSLGPSRAASMASGRRVVKLPQVHQGVPVAHRGATVTFGSDGVARLVTARLAEELPADVVPTVSAQDVVSVASKAAGLDMDAKSARLVVWPSGGGNVLAWHFYSAPQWAIPYAPVVVVDAKTGQLVTKYNAAQSNHQGLVYPTNPVKSPQTQVVELGLPAGATTLTSPLVRARNCIDNKTTTTVMGFLKIHVCDLEQTVVTDPGTGEFNVTPAADTDPEDPFAEMHIYYHTERAYEFFRAFDPTFLVQQGAIEAVANLRLPAGLMQGDLQKAGDPNIPLEPFQNAFFSPGDPLFGSIFNISGGAMMFGQGPAKDYSYDADVIYHEFTHAVVNATIQFVGTPHHDAYGLVVSPGAMNEGLADYFAAAATGDPDVGEYAVLDFDPSGKAIRSLADADACPGAIAGEVHEDATLFSAALWDVRTALSAAEQPRLDLAVFEAMNAAPSGDLNFHEFAEIIISAVKSSPLGNAVGTMLTEAFTKRGVLPQCTRILDYNDGTMQGPLPAGPGIGVWFAPSTQAANISQNQLGYVPGVFQVRVPLPANTDSLTIDFEGATSGGGGFGGGGEFTPKVLVRFAAEPIQFTYGPFATTADTIVLSPDGSGGSGLQAYNTSTSVPAGATTAYVMIANSGAGDGLFTNLSFATTQSAGVGGAGGGGVGGSGGAGGSGAGGNPADPLVTDDGGCGCSVPGQSSVPAGASLAALAAVAGLMARRRRS